MSGRDLTDCATADFDATAYKGTATLGLIGVGRTAHREHQGIWFDGIRGEVATHLRIDGADVAARLLGR